MKIHTWQRFLQASHFLGFIFEAVIYAFTFLLLTEIGAIFEFFHRGTAYPCAALIIFCALCVRFRNIWTNSKMWHDLHVNYPDLKDTFPVAKDFLSSRIHGKNSEMVDLAMQQIQERTKGVRYPWANMIFRQPREYYLSVIFLIVPFLTALVHFEEQAQEQIEITLTPPDYLNLPARQVDLQEDYLEVYPGSLFSCTIFDKRKFRLSDKFGSLFLPYKNKQKHLRYEVRILKPNEVYLNLEKRKIKTWVFSLLKDEKPKIRWEHAPINTKVWKPVHFSYSASDDIALADAFFMINGRELEYVGTPSGLKRYRYSWRFDPLDHIDLMGGKIECQVVVYDQDKVLGPKSATTPSITWEFLGVKEQTEQAMKTIEKLQKLHDKRIAKLKDQPSPPDQNVSDLMKQFQKEVGNNPVMPENLMTMMNNMKSEYDRLLKQSKSSPNRLRQKESKQLTRNQLYLDFIKSKLQDILNTLTTANLVSKMHKMSKELERGKSVSPEKYEDLFKETKEHLEKTNMNSWEKNALLQNMEKSQLANMFGKTRSASESLNKAAEMLRRSENQGSSNSSQLTQKFTEKIKTLQHLIKNQNKASIDYQKALLNPTASKEAEDLQKRIQRMDKEIEAHKGLAQYKKLYEDYQKSLSKGIVSKKSEELLKQLSQRSNRELKGLKDQQAKLKALSERVGRMGYEMGTRNFANSLMPPERFNEYKLPERTQQAYKRLHNEIKNPPPTRSNIPQKLQDEQKGIHKTGSDFAKDFRRDFEMLLPDSFLYHAADQAAWHAGKASSMIKTSNTQTLSQMVTAQRKWVQMRNRLGQMMQRARQAMSASSKLRIGRDGKLRLQRKKSGQQGREGGKRDMTRDIEIALPEDFQKAENIEKRLQKELKSIPLQRDAEIFKNYMIDLLQ